MKGAHADLSSTAWQEIGVKPFLSLEWATMPPTPVVIRRRVRHGAFISLAAGSPRSKNGLKSVWVSKGSTPSRRFSHATPT